METRQQLILRVIEEMGPLISTQLVKLVYLVDYVHFQHYGDTITGFRYCWDHYGPNAVGHGIVNEANELAKQGLLRRSEEPNVYGGTTTLYELPNPSGIELTAHAEQVMGDTLRLYGKLDLRELIEASKRTEPFQRIGQYELIDMAQVAPASQEESCGYKATLKGLNEESSYMTLEELQEQWAR